MKITASSSEQYMFVETAIISLPKELRDKIVTAEYAIGFEHPIVKVSIQGTYNGLCRTINLPKSPIEVNLGTERIISIHYENIIFYTYRDNLDWIRFDK